VVQREEKGMSEVLNPMAGVLADLKGKPKRPLPTPAATALEAAESLAKYAKKEAPVRYGFISRERGDLPKPPLARLLRGERGGSGGNVRLGLMLSMLWYVHDDPTLVFPARAWAALLGLDGPEVQGARRIKTALRWLESNGLIRLETAPGHDTVIHLLEETGSGRRYELPGATYARLQSNAAAAAPHRYIRLPRELWTHGWLSVMSGPAIAMMLILWAESGRDVASEQPPLVWLSPKMAEERYAVSEDTRLKGARELTRLGLIRTSRRAVTPESFEFRRGRNVHQVNLATLTAGPPGTLLDLGPFRSLWLRSVAQ
jgi:hypothetical protein